MKPRTVDEIADAILPPSIDGIHEHALCLLLAEHERDIAELREQLPKLPPGEWTRESVAAFNTARFESGEDAQASAVSGQAIPYMSNAAAKPAGDGLRAPGSTAPTTEEANLDAEWLDTRYATGTNSARMMTRIAMRLRALAADRDRLRRELAAADRALVAECNRLEAERDALQRRIEAMAQREPTQENVDAIWMIRWERGGAGNTSDRLFRYVRDAILATPASEPSEGSCPQCGRGICAGCPPAPATPSAEDVEWWRQWFLAQDEIPIDYAQGLAERLSADVSKREAGLRENREYWRNACIEAQQHRDGANAQVAEFERDLTEARAQLAAATESERMWREGFTTAVLTLRSHSDVYEAWRVLNHRSKS